MNLRRFYPHAWLLVGIIIFAQDAFGDEVAVSTGSLAGSATGAALAIVEPFVNPFGTKMPKIVSGYGKREIPPQLKRPVVTSGAAFVPVMQEIHEGVDYAAFPG